MARVNNVCPGDCSNCELREQGIVTDMVPCVLDQMFQQIQGMRKDIAELAAKVKTKETKTQPTFVGGTEKEE